MSQEQVARQGHEVWGGPRHRSSVEGARPQHSKSLWAEPPQEEESPLHAGPPAPTQSGDMLEKLEDSEHLCPNPPLALTLPSPD